MSDADVAFCRSLLAQLAPEVKALGFNAWRGAEWVYKTGRQDWEFHGPERFYWHGRAANAYDARYKGWSAWLDKQREKAAPRLLELAHMAAALTWGSEEQIDAENAFHALAEKHLSAEEREELERDCYKATTPERLAQWLAKLDCADAEAWLRDHKEQEEQA